MWQSGKCTPFGGMKHGIITPQCVWSGNATITNCRQTCGTARKSHTTIQRYQESSQLFIPICTVCLCSIKRHYAYMLMYSFSLNQISDKFEVYLQIGITPKTICVEEVQPIYHFILNISFTFQTVWHFLDFKYIRTTIYEKRYIHKMRTTRPHTATFIVSEVIPQIKIHSAPYAMV